MRVFLTAVAIAVGAALLYLPDLAGSPFYLNRDEMFFGLTAHSLVTTGVDANGHYLPLYTQSPMRYGSEMWFQPALMYSAAIAVKFFGLTEGTIRLPMALFGIADIVLMYFIGRRLFRRELPAIACAVLLAVTPAHYIHSRVAMDFQAPLPFLLAWLLCLLTYLENGRKPWLVAAGLSLGIGLYTYIAAYMWMPVYLVLTMIVLLMRREPISRYALAIAGFAVPALSSIPFLLTHPTVIRDVMWHYDRGQPQTAGGADLFVTYFGYERFAKAAWVYWKFWGPRFLFVDGPGALWAAGALLFPTAGLLVIGLVATLRRSRPEAVLIVGGLITAAIPASLVGDLDAVHRASAVLPFAVLVAVAGLDSLWTTRSSAIKTAAFVTVFGILIVLASQFHDYLPLAQAAIRASTVPLAIAGLCAIWSFIDRNSVGSRPCWLAAIGTIALMQIAYVVLGFGLTAWLSLVVLIVAFAAISGEPAWPSPTKNLLAAVALAAAASHFMWAHAEYSAFGRMGFVPATAIIMFARFAYSVVALAAFLALLRLMAKTDAPRPGTITAAALGVSMVVLQFAYFHIDYFSDHRARTLYAATVFAAAAVIAALALRAGSFSRDGLGRIATAAICGLVAIQFGYFYADYFTRYRDTAGHFDTEGNARIVWEAVLDEAQRRDVPAIYFGSVGPYGFSDLYWQFYAIKRGRQDLLPRTTAAAVLDLDVVRSLPPASLVVTSPSPGTDAAIARMTTSGTLRSPRLLVAPDGQSKFWLIETGPGS